MSNKLPEPWFSWINPTTRWPRSRAEARVISENLKTLPQRLMAKFLKKRGWVCFYLKEEQRDCNSKIQPDFCWLKCYVDGEPKNPVPKELRGLSKSKQQQAVDLLDV
jgi:hypothetical protein